MPWRNRRTAFSTLGARPAMCPSQSTFHRPLSRDLAQLKRSNEANVPSAMVCRRLLSRRYASVLLRSLARSSNGWCMLRAKYLRFWLGGRHWGLMGQAWQSSWCATYW